MRMGQPTGKVELEPNQDAYSVPRTNIVTEKENQNVYFYEYRRKIFL